MHTELLQRLFYGAARIRNGWLKPDSKLGAAVISIIAHNHDYEFPFLCWHLFPDFISIGTPFYCTAARINKAGQIVADEVEEDGHPPAHDRVVFESTKHMEGSFRRLADAMKLNDADRRDLFAAVQKWVVADRRLDPMMDPMDPDAKRLTAH